MKHQLSRPIHGNSSEKSKIEMYLTFGFETKKSNFMQESTAKLRIRAIELWW